MNIIDILEGRMTQLFEGNQIVTPFSFKQLARVAVHQMRHNVAKIDGHKFAPTLYTVLINPVDDRVMAPLYQQVTDELVDFIAHEAANEGFEMQDVPVVRFIAEQTVKQGAIDVIAEVVPPNILTDLRREEAAYIQSRNQAGIGARPTSQASNAAQDQQVRQQVQPGQQVRPHRQTNAESAPAPSARQPRGASGACELTDIKTGRTWRISVPSTIIGREGSTADLLLADTNVSRRHAELSRTSQGWRIADLGSTNGTRVNGKRVQQTDLSTGDIITLGLIELSFKEL